jgi:hypothetical protein
MGRFAGACRSRSKGTLIRRKWLLLEPLWKEDEGEELVMYCDVRQQLHASWHVYGKLYCCDVSQQLHGMSIAN